MEESRFWDSYLAWLRPLQVTEPITIFLNSAAQPIEYTYFWLKNLYGSDSFFYLTCGNLSKLGKVIIMYISKVESKIINLYQHYFLITSIFVIVCWQKLGLFNSYSKNCFTTLCSKSVVMLLCLLPLQFGDWSNLHWWFSDWTWVILWNSLTKW